MYAFKIYTIDFKNANEILAKTLKYLHRNNTHTKTIQEFAACMNNKETLSKMPRADRVTLFVQFWFKFANKKQFKNQAVIIYSDTSLKSQSCFQWNLDPYRARSLRGSLLLLAYVPPHVDVGVDS